MLDCSCGRTISRREGLTLESYNYERLVCIPQSDLWYDTLGDDGDLRCTTIVFLCAVQDRSITPSTLQGWILLLVNVTPDCDLSASA